MAVPRLYRPEELAQLQPPAPPPPAGGSVAQPPAAPARPALGLADSLLDGVRAQRRARFGEIPGWSTPLTGPTPFQGGAFPGGGNNLMALLAQMARQPRQEEELNRLAGPGGVGAAGGPASASASPGGSTATTTSGGHAGNVASWLSLLLSGGRF